jgi:endonuclease/exonuclease/phosphatase family metal-dependent hydrolase
MTFRFGLEMRRLALVGAVLAALWGQACAAPVDEKIATWNLNWLTLRQPGDRALPDDVRGRSVADFVRLRSYADRLNADVVAFQEVDGTATASRIFDTARYTLITIGEDVVQQVGLAVRRPITVRQNPDVTAIDVEPDAPHRLRDGLDATLTFPSGIALRVLVIHLKNGCHYDKLQRSRRPQCSLLAQQIPPLANWVQARQAEGVAFMVLGDFNRVMDRPEDMTRALNAVAPLTRVTAGQSDPCWRGQSFIDHIFLGGPARAWLVPGSLRVMTYNSSDPRDRDRLSDHCPVSVHLSLP